jgi:hypothetical protein
LPPCFAYAELVDNSSWTGLGEGNPASRHGRPGRSSPLVFSFNASPAQKGPARPSATIAWMITPPLDDRPSAATKLLSIWTCQETLEYQVE